MNPRKNESKDQSFWSAAVSLQEKRKAEKKAEEEKKKLKADCDQWCWRNRRSN